MNRIYDVVILPDNGNLYIDSEENVWHVVMDDKGVHSLEMNAGKIKTTIHSYLWDVISIEGLRYIPKKVKVTKNVERWLNLYKTGVGQLYHSQVAANRYAGVDRIACIKMTGTYETEEFDTADAVKPPVNTADAVCAHAWDDEWFCIKCGVSAGNR